jgi:hypothetical protein
MSVSPTTCLMRQDALQDGGDSGTRFAGDPPPEPRPAVRSSSGSLMQPVDASHNPREALLAQTWHSPPILFPMAKGNSALGDLSVKA